MTTTPRDDHDSEGGSWPARAVDRMHPALPEEDRDRVRLLAIAAMSALLWGPAWVAAAPERASAQLGTGIAIHAALIALSPVVLWLTRSLAAAANTVLAGSFGLVVLVATVGGGIWAPIVVWLAVLPLIAFLMAGTFSGVSWSALTVAGIVGIFLTNSPSAPAGSAAHLSIFPLARTLNLLAVAVVLTTLGLTTARRTGRALGDASARKESALADATPQRRRPPEIVAVAPNVLVPSGDEDPETDRARILLAEDNVINQQVTREMLHWLGHEVDIAVNGREALEALESAPYDLVLMDCQMPELDGLEATRLLRQREHGQGRRIPVAAVTAGATSGDRDRCLAAGMDDYLAKPFVIAQLAELLERWLPAGPERPDLSVAPARPPSPLDAGALDELRSLRKSDGALLVDEVIAAYVGSLSGSLATLDESLREEDADGLSRGAHSLKSSSATLGAWLVADLCGRLEALGRTGTTKGAAGLLDTLHDACASTRRALIAERSGRRDG